MDSFDTTAQTFNWVNFFCLIIILAERFFHWLYIVRTSKCQVSLGGCLKCLGDVETDAKLVETELTELSTPSAKELHDAGVTKITHIAPTPTSK